MTNEGLAGLVRALRVERGLSLTRASLNVRAGYTVEASFDSGRASAFAASAALLESYLYPTQDGGCNDD
jgi:hypothetical protein